jgi:hypothetical protein
MAPPLPKLAQANFAAVVKHATLPPEAAPILAGCTDVTDALDRLEAAGMASEAVRVLAQALPKRECVWWACVCAQSNAPADLPEPDRQAREAAELWVRQQKDEHRRRAFDHAEVNGFQSPEAWAGAAAFWSGDSISTPDLPPIPPPPHLTGTATAAALALAAIRGGGALQPMRLKRFLESGRDIAAGGPGKLTPETS